MNQTRTRLNLQTLLEEKFGSKRVYYQPPENLKMEYPAIRYSSNDYNYKHADNIKYTLRKEYKITVIDRRPDNPVIDKLLELEYSSFEQHYVVDGLYHDVIKLIY